MLRWLALSLIVANLIYAGWQFRPQPEAVDRPRSPMADYSGAARLVLLKERADSAGVAVPGGATPATADLTGDPDRARVPLPHASVTDEAPIDPAPSGPPIDARTGDAESIPDQLAGPPPAPLCGALGPFAEEISAKQVLGRLVDAGIVAALESREVVARYDHWVHIPPLADRDAALRVLHQLQQRRIDSFLITDGELANGISLGIFSRQGSAQKLAARHQSLGFDIAIRPLPRNEVQRWLLVQPDLVADIDAPLLAELRKGGMNIEFLRQPCADVAPALQFD